MLCSRFNSYFRLLTTNRLNVIGRVRRWIIPIRIMWTMIKKTKGRTKSSQHSVVIYACAGSLRREAGEKATHAGRAAGSGPRPDPGPGPDPVCCYPMSPTIVAPETMMPTIPSHDVMKASLAASLLLSPGGASGGQ